MVDLLLWLPVNREVVDLLEPETFDQILLSLSFGAEFSKNLVDDKLPDLDLKEVDLYLRYCKPCDRMEGCQLLHYSLLEILILDLLGMLTLEVE